MNSTATVTTGTVTQKFELYYQSIDKFIVGLQEIASETGIAAAYQIEHCRKGIVRQGVVFPGLAALGEVN